MIDKVNGKMHGHLIEKAQRRDKWREWCTEPALGRELKQQ